MKNNNTLAFLSVIICLLSSAVYADTLQSVLSDAVNDVLVATKTATCNINPYIVKPVTDQWGYTSFQKANEPCANVVASCPTGATIIPGISNCKRTPNANFDAKVLVLLKASSNNPNSTVDANIKGGPVNQPNSQVASAYQCHSDVGYSQSGSGQGYTPYCFFDLSKVQTVNSGAQKYYHPDYVNFSGNLVYLNGYSGSVQISLNDYNNPKNWTCYPVYATTTARCITLPAGLLNKLGFQ